VASGAWISIVSVTLNGPGGAPSAEPQTAMANNAVTAKLLFM
jgi:hypothetical protein